MKTNINVIKEIELNNIIVKAGVRYWVDCEYSEDNGNTWVEHIHDDEETNEEFKNHIPFVKNESVDGGAPGDYWNLDIDIETGMVKNWPKKYCIRTHFKVCDDGLYQIIDIDGNVVWDSIKTNYYYVPDFLSIGDDGYGDYMYLEIDGRGYIKDWKDVAVPRIKKLLMNY